MDYLQNPRLIIPLIAICILIVGLVCYFVFRKKDTVDNSQTQIEPVQDDNAFTDIYPFTNDFTPIDAPEPDENNEDFGMYTGALDTWLEHHPSGSSVDRYTTNKKKKVLDISSVNNPVPQKEETEISEANFSDFITHN